MGNAITLTDDSFQSEVIESSVPVLVDFWATWCGPCRMVAPIVDELAQEYDGRVKVGKVDVDSEQKIAGGLKIQSIPTLLIYKDGKLAHKMTGFTSKDDLVEKLESVL